jgi:phosphatidylglycerophosphatase A
MPLAVALALGGPWVFLGGTAATIAIAFWSAGAGERCLGEKDPHAVVIDEVAGQLVTLAFIPLSPALFVAGFFLFRAFDVLKVPPARQLERVRGGAGIVLDDLAAGLWANVVLQIARAVVSRGGGP